MTHDEQEIRWLRAAFAAALRARESGNAPFGALLVAADGTLLGEGGNTVLTTGDCTGHAELNVLREATQRHDAATLAGATLYASTEPCAMCAGATFWSGVGRVVFGLSAARLLALVGAGPERPALHLSCRELFARADRPIEVIGPLLEDEALAVHGLAP